MTNAAADGSSIKLADPAGEVTEWRLDYAELTDAEAAALQQFFEAAEGMLNGFTFLDPTANLLAWSGKLDEEVWERDPLLSATSGVTDPMGGTKAWRITNGGAGAQSIAQTLAAPGVYTYCLSAYVRSAAMRKVTLLVGDGRAERIVTDAWSRIVFACTGDPAESSIRLGLEIPAEATLEVFGFQVEAQAGASAYKASTRGGVYQNARLRDDELSITSTGVNRHACTIYIIHVNHL